MNVVPQRDHDFHDMCVSTSRSSYQCREVRRYKFYACTSAFIATGGVQRILAFITVSVFVSLQAMTYSACYAGIGQAPDYHGVDQYVPASLVDRNGAPPNRVPPPNRVFVWWPKRLAVAKATDRNYWLAELIEENCEPPGTKKNKSG